MDPVLFVLLIIVGVIIVGFVYFDAKRRQVIRQEKRDQKKFEQQFSNSSDDAGYDLDGIGQVRLVESAQKKVIQEKVQQANDSVVNQTQPVKVKPEESASNTNISATKEDPSVGQSEVPVLDDMLFGFDKDKLEDTGNDKIEPTIEQPSQASLFDEADSEPAVQAEPEVIFTLYLVSPSDAPYQGESLVQALLAQGMRHGDMNIFHRHSQATGRGAVQFSLASAYEPGTFDLDHLDQLETKGLAVFMALPGPKKPMKAYELMIKTCKAITEELGGYIIDSSKAHFSKQIELHHKEQIQEFERKLLLKQS